jgi:hypothetical protein
MNFNDWLNETENKRNENNKSELINDQNVNTNEKNKTYIKIHPSTSSQ